MNSSHVCKQWFQLLASPEVWKRE
ncbi:hypothetical protein [Planktothrix agardhii]